MAGETAAISFRKLLRENSVTMAEEMITKWDPGASRATYADVASIFLESRDEARRFLFAVDDVRRSTADTRRRVLLEIAMSRLRREFAEILQYNRDASPLAPRRSQDASSTFRSYFPDDASDGEDAFSSAAQEYLRAVAECMVACGHGAECAEIYKRSRRAVVEEGMSRLGIEHVSCSHVQKLNWESLDFRIKQWVAAARAVFEEIFTGERVLCDSIFSSDEHLADSCFADITRDAAVQFFRFPAVVASKHKRTQEKVLHFLAMYRSIRDLSPEIDAAFSSKPTNVVRSQIEATLQSLAIAVRSMLGDLEAAIHKDSSRTLPTNCGLHLLAKSVMNQLVHLADHADVISELYADDPLPTMIDIAPKLAVCGKTKKLEPIEEGAEEEEEEDGGVGAVGATATCRFVWIITILLCKLDMKAEHYKDAAQSYLFLANNHLYVVSMVKESKLAHLLGHTWVSGHEAKARAFARSFLKVSWNRVLDAVPADPAALPGVEARRKRMAQFNRIFEETCKNQVGWVVLDKEVREEIKSAVARNLVARYRPFYDKCRADMRVEEGAPAAVRFAPEDLVAHLSGLYRKKSNSVDWESDHHGEVEIFRTGSGSTGKGSRWRWLIDSK